MAKIDIHPLRTVLDRPHAYAGRERWRQILIDDVLPRLPADVRVQAARRIQSASALSPASVGLVHGDLAGANLLWSPDGTLSGILDWDLASASDPAIDVACLAWFGWPAVRAITDAATYQRARTWFAIFGLEQISAALLNGRTEAEINAVVNRAANRIRTTAADPRAKQPPARGMPDSTVSTVVSADCRSRSRSRGR